MKRTLTRILCLASLTFLALLSCDTLEMHPLDPALAGNFGDSTLAQDQDGNGVSDYLDEFAPGCSLSAVACLGIAKANKQREVSATPSVTAFFAPKSAAPGKPLAGSVETRLKDSLTLRIADTSLLPIAMRIWSRDSDGVRTDTTSGPELTLRYDARGTHKLTVRSLTRWGQGYRVSRPSQPLYVEVRLYEPTALAGKDTAMAYGDTLAIMGAGTAAGGGFVEMAWSLDSSRGFSAGDGGRLVLVAPQRDTEFVAILRVMDHDSLYGYDTLRVLVRDGSPIVSAGPDRNVGSGDSVTLTGIVRYAKGVPAGYAWSLDGGATFIRTPGVTVAFRAPKREDSLAAIFRVIDTKGRAGSDTAVLHVLGGPPKADAKSTSSSGKAGNLLRLRASGTDDGGIVGYAWNIGPGDSFLDTPSDTQVVIPNVNPWVLVLRVMDDDSLFGYDTVKVAVTLPPGPIVGPLQCFGKCSQLTPNDSIGLRGTITPSQAGFAITKRAWSCGEGDTVLTGADSARVRLPRTAGTINCRVVATQSNGGSNESPVSVIVLPDKPTVTLSGPADLAFGETAAFVGKAKDNLGRIIESGWDFDGDGKLDTLKQSSDTLFALDFKPTSLRPFQMIYRAMDDDSSIAEDTVAVTVYSPLGGSLAVDSSLASAGNPWRLNRNMKIEPGVTLTLQPGVVLEIPDTLRLKVRGALRAVGTESDSIRIRTTGRNRPAQMFLIDTATLVTYAGETPADGSQFKYCSFDRCAFSMTKSNFHLEKSTLVQCYLYAANSYTSVVKEPVHMMDLELRNNYLYVTNDTGLIKAVRISDKSGQPGALNLTARRVVVEDSYLKMSGSQVYHGDTLSLRRTTFDGDQITLARGSSSAFLDIRSNLFIGEGGTPHLQIPDRLRGEISDNSFQDFPIAAAYGTASADTLVIRNNSFEGSGKYLYNSSGSAAYYLYNAILHHNIFKRSAGTYFTHSLDSTVRFESNHIETPEAGGYFIKVMDSKRRAVMDNFKNNYWGTSVLADIEARIYDYDFDFILPQVDVSPILTAPPAGAGPRTLVGRQ